MFLSRHALCINLMINRSFEWMYIVIFTYVCMRILNHVKKVFNASVTIIIQENKYE